MDGRNGKSLTHDPVELEAKDSLTTVSSDSIDAPLQPSNSSDNHEIPPLLKRFFIGAFHQPLTSIEEYFGEKVWPQDELIIVLIHTLDFSYCHCSCFVPGRILLCVAPTYSLASDFSNYRRPYCVSFANHFGELGYPASSILCHAGNDLDIHCARQLEEESIVSQSWMGIYELSRTRSDEAPILWRLCHRWDYWRTNSSLSKMEEMAEVLYFHSSDTSFHFRNALPHPLGTRKQRYSIGKISGREER